MPYDNAVEYVSFHGKPLAYIIRVEMNPEKTIFLTPQDFNLQLGFVVYTAGGEVARHTHRPLERHIVGTNEVLFIKKGRCEVDIYNDDREVVATLQLRTGDVMLMVGGGHGFRMLEDTILLEVKQGPYTGLDEKERF